MIDQLPDGVIRLRRHWRFARHSLSLMVIPKCRLMTAKPNDH